MDTDSKVLCYSNSNTNSAKRLRVTIKKITKDDIPQLSLSIICILELHHYRLFTLLSSADRTFPFFMAGRYLSMKIMIRLC